MQVVYTRGALLWQQLTSPGQLKSTGRLSYKSKRKVLPPDTLVSFPSIAVYVMHTVLRCVALCCTGTRAAVVMQVYWVVTGNPRCNALESQCRCVAHAGGSEGVKWGGGRAEVVEEGAKGGGDL